MCICKADDEEKFLLQTWHKCFGTPAAREKVRLLVISRRITVKNNNGEGVRTWLPLRNW